MLELDYQPPGFDGPSAAAVEQVRRERSIGLSEAVNRLIRAGLRAPQPRREFVQRSSDLGLKIDVANVAEALDLLDGFADSDVDRR
jgi:hypothetical protein